MSQSELEPFDTSVPSFNNVYLVETIIRTIHSIIVSAPKIIKYTSSNVLALDRIESKYTKNIISTP
ncbi:MAG: hypothetical protein ACTTIS_00075 [Streptobacillus sp.]